MKTTNISISCPTSNLHYSRPPNSFALTVSLGVTKVMDKPIPVQQT